MNKELKKSCGHRGDRDGCRKFSFCPLMSMITDTMTIKYDHEFSDKVARKCEDYAPLSLGEIEAKKCVEEKLESFYEWLKLWSKDTVNISHSRLIHKIEDITKEFAETFKDFVD
jgi:hypothetical protein